MTKKELIFFENRLFPVSIVYIILLTLSIVFYQETVFIDEIIGFLLLLFSFTTILSNEYYVKKLIYIKSLLVSFVVCFVVVFLLFVLKFPEHRIIFSASIFPFVFVVNYYIYFFLFGLLFKRNPILFGKNNIGIVDFAYRLLVLFCPVLISFLIHDLVEGCFISF